MSDYNKLTITSDKSEGSFVRNLVGQTGTGFEKGTHVHKDWWAKTKTYEQVMQNLQLSINTLLHKHVPGQTAMYIINAVKCGVLLGFVQTKVPWAWYYATLCKKC